MHERDGGSPRHRPGARRPKSLDSQEDYARLQVARLNKALRYADKSLEEGEVKAIPHFVKVVAELDRYHGLARPMRLGKPARRPRTSRLPPPPLALTDASETPALQPQSAREVVSAWFQKRS